MDAMMVARIKMFMAMKRKFGNQITDKLVTGC